MLEIGHELLTIKKASGSPIFLDNAKRFILLDVPTVKVPVIFEANSDLPRFISKSPGEALHIFEKVEAKKAYIESVIQSFWPIANIAFDKTYFIKNFTCACNPEAAEAKIIGITESELKFKNVLILVKKDNLMRIFFQTEDDKVFGAHARFASGGGILDFFTISKPELRIVYELGERASQKFKKIVQDIQASEIEEDYTEEPLYKALLKDSDAVKAA